MSNSTYTLDEKLLVSRGARFLNYVIDQVFLMILLFALLFISSLISGLLGSTSLSMWINGLGDFGWNIIYITALIVYYITMEGFLGRTVAKYITGSIVVDENGEIPSFGTITKRTLCRCIPFDVLTYLGGSRGWHDSISDTYVVNKKALDEEVKSFHEFNLIGVKESN
ncbi:RDD family protein [Flavobacterium branchiicola]|uniref:RDD family protein n=1 Tax=Flavobacterium branchiicola TaxID=1114875 RepID=A0ABV9P9I1_9FLAO|nr:RDD family protein [Flavobacterium branchiicola]MBS7252839.1 RDD family protein [Flavobacterium branchiicola]